MKFWLAWLAYALFAVLLAAGMVLAHARNFWLLLFAVALYGIMLWRFGLTQGSSH
jgi:general stress protein CsbA